MNLRLLFTSLLMATGILSYAQITSIGVIGDATPTGWDSDTDMIQDAADTSLWSLDIELIPGSVKFRANDDWAMNWGGVDFPVGIGTQDGPNIPIENAGLYSITFNSTTGDYAFGFDSDIGIIGDATPGGWDEDTDMFPSTADSNVYTLTLDLVPGFAKFRADNDWAVNWGSPDYPSGVGVQDGDNIPIENAGRYNVTFNRATGDYNFEEVVTIGSIGIIGDATPGGWDEDTDMARDGLNPDMWTLTVTLTDGEAKFRANDDWAVNWGSTDFPSGVAVQDGDNIPVTAGDYLVQFNSATGDYNFLPVGNFGTVGILGDATPGGWDEDTDLTQSADDASVWSTRLVLTDGEAKFRADDDWTINWGAGDFPVGVATQDGANIPITAGEYDITFNTTTGEYSFAEVIVFTTVGLIGPATPIGDWDTDVDMTHSDVDEHFWFIPEIALVDGEAKFRAEDDWAINWGLEDFPSGTGTQDGPNILITGGTYRVEINTSTGDYSFTDPSSTIDLLDAKVIQMYPVPTGDQLNIEIDELALTGSINLKVLDITGKILMDGQYQNNGIIQLNTSSLTNGQYILQISNKKNTVGKMFSVAK